MLHGKEKRFVVTTAHRKMIKVFVQTGNKSAAGRAAGFSESYARELFGRHEILDVLNEAQKKAGLTDELLLGAHVELLNQTEDKSVRLGAIRLGYQVNKKLGYDDGPPVGLPPQIIIVRTQTDDGDDTGKRAVRTHKPPNVSIRRANE